MSRAVTSEEEILKVSCGIVAKKGIAAVNMRTVASECGIALGSLYNYFIYKNSAKMQIIRINTAFRKI